MAERTERSGDTLSTGKGPYTYMCLGQAPELAGTRRPEDPTHMRPSKVAPAQRSRASARLELAPPPSEREHRGSRRGVEGEQRGGKAASEDKGD